MTHHNAPAGRRFRPDWDTQKPNARIHRGFGYRDSKRREFGGIAYTGTIEAEEVPEGSVSWSSYHTLKRTGLHHYFVPHAARDSKPYGASRPYQFFDTPEERDAAVERYFKGAEKRAEKNRSRY